MQRRAGRAGPRMGSGSFVRRTGRHSCYHLGLATLYLVLTRAGAKPLVDSAAGVFFSVLALTLRLIRKTRSVLLLLQTALLLLPLVQVCSFASPLLEFSSGSCSSQRCPPLSKKKSCAAATTSVAALLASKMNEHQPNATTLAAVAAAPMLPITANLSC